MTEKLNIVQSTTEPDKRNIWLKDNELKKFGAKGWSTIGGKGGDVSLDGPQVSELSGSELIPINDNGESKVITVNNLLESNKDICKVIIDFVSLDLINYTEVIDAIVNGNKYFIAEYRYNSIEYKSPILNISYDKEKKNILISLIYFNNQVLYIVVSSEDGKMLDGITAIIPFQIIVPKLSTGATLEDVVSAYNNLVSQLIDSGIAKS